jgi:hypothetical protein
MFDLEDPDEQDDYDNQQEQSTTDIHGPGTSLSTYTAGIAPSRPGGFPRASGSSGVQSGLAWWSDRPRSVLAGAGTKEGQCSERVGPGRFQHLVDADPFVRNVR